MTNTKMLQILIDGQATLKEDVKDGQNKIQREMKEGFKKVNDRIDALGSQLNVLDEDAPTREEFDKLEETVEKVATKTASL